MQRGGKRKVCSYFTTHGFCFYGDQCQFVHARPTAPGPLALGQVPPGRSKSPAHNQMTMGDHKNMSDAAAFPPHAYPQQHPRSYMYPVTQHPPPKGGGGWPNPDHAPSSAAGRGQARSPQRLVHQQPMKAYPGAAGQISSLNPPPFSKPSKPRQLTSPQTQVEAGGTTYFISPDQQPSYAPGYSMYTKPLTNVARSTRAPSFFTPESLRQDLLARESICLSQPLSADSCPSEVDHYHNLCPLERVDTTPPDQEVARSFGHPSTCYKCINSKDGLYYCLRRIHGFRLSSGRAVLEQLESWRKLQHVNLVTLREMFTTKAFGDNSVVFVYDYHPGAESMAARHHKSTRRSSPLPEDLVWEYVIQLVSALRLVHSANLALRCIHPTKLLLTSPHRLRISCAGIMDIVSTTANTLPTPIQQQGDLVATGEALLCVALQSASAAKQEFFPASMEILATSYSPDLQHIIQYLLQSGSKGPPHNVVEVLPMVGGRVYSSLETSQLQQDYLEGELSKELQNGRLFRLLAKLGTVNERPEFSGDPQWSETGDRYLMKLFRDHLFHQVHNSGKPWVDLAHIVQTLNKLDAGVEETVALHSRDEQSVLVVTYAELKRCLQTTFTDVLSSSENKATPKT
ncbi:PAN2-PAN3 deadenylation complex subunit pan3-like [Halichondria panicea]|uniref:PAN2-PAN3 deadenylation complex subunit pan3-like n=1 Tax=Halichondria panicea TaxID=6063 RepID=UPI00312B78E3